MRERSFITWYRFRRFWGHPPTPSPYYHKCVIIGLRHPPTPKIIQNRDIFLWNLKNIVFFLPPFGRFNIFKIINHIINFEMSTQECPFSIVGMWLRTLQKSIAEITANMESCDSRTAAIESVPDRVLTFWMRMLWLILWLRLTELSILWFLMWFPWFGKTCSEVDRHNDRWLFFSAADEKIWELYIKLEWGYLWRFWKFQ